MEPKFIKIKLDARAGDIIATTAEPLEPGWTTNGEVWWKVADVHDAGRWVEVRASGQEE